MSIEPAFCNYVGHRSSLDFGQYLFREIAACERVPYAGKENGEVIRPCFRAGKRADGYEVGRFIALGYELAQLLRLISRWVFEVAKCFVCCMSRDCWDFLSAIVAIHVVVCYCDW
jgi:hypothetical protein